MNTIWLAPVLIVGMLLLFAALRTLLQRRYPVDNNPLIDAVDAMLPQTQCAQCNYPGCRPYAEAIVTHAAPLNLCPPGGAPLHRRLVELLGDNSEAVDAAPPVLPEPAVAVIDEQRCIGCTLCLPACPVDAIVGAQGLMHTVLDKDCTGCELCIPACPVDCITLLPHAVPEQVIRERALPGQALPGQLVPQQGPVNTGARATARGCINCGHCNTACPLSLPVQELLHLVQTEQADTAVQSGLRACVECGLCDRVCPSDIPLADVFGTQIAAANVTAATNRQREALKKRYQAHVQREQDKAATAADKRSARLAKTSSGRTDRWR